MWTGRLSRSGFCSRAGERERRAGGVRSRHPADKASSRKFSLKHDYGDKVWRRKGSGYQAASS